MGADQTYSLAELRDVIRDALQPTIQLRRAGRAYYEDVEEVEEGPVTEAEVDEFIEVNPLFESWVAEELLDPGIAGFDTKRAILSEEAFEEFEDGLSWAEIQDWTAGDDTVGSLNVAVRQGLFAFNEPDRHSIFKPPPGFSGQLATSPSLIALGQELVRKGDTLHNLDPRQFEELVADLLKRDGWKVLLTPRSRDGGVDVIAERTDPLLGLLRTVWEAKRYNPKTNKVGVSIIRELSACVEDNRGTKGVLVTTGLLTKGALDYVEQRKHRVSAAEFGKVEDWLFGRVKLA